MEKEKMCEETCETKTKESKVDENYSCQCNALEELKAVIMQLENRLTPVCSPQDITSNKEQEELEQCESEMARKIRTSTRSIGECGGMVSRIISSLEI